VPAVQITSTLRLKGDGFQIERRHGAAGDADALLRWFADGYGITTPDPRAPRVVEDYDRTGTRTGITFYVDQPFEIVDEATGERRRIKPISGGSHGVSEGCSTDMAPHTPPARLVSELAAPPPVQTLRGSPRSAAAGR
jgi:hypothetical protein